MFKLFEKYPRFVTGVIKIKIFCVTGVIEIKNFTQTIIFIGMYLV